MSYWSAGDEDAESDSGLPLATALSRRQRRQANTVMRRFRSVPCERHAHFVQLTAIALPPQIRALGALDRTERSCWILSKRAARTLIERDRAAGGNGFFHTFECRRCLVCRRILLGREAADYRERCRWPKSKYYWPWGPCCNAVCKPTEKRAARAIANGEIRPQRVRNDWSA
jgi:hypothetical protein